MSDAAAIRKQLKIHTAVVTRLNKELAMYQKEVAEEEKKLETLTSSGADAAEIRRQEGIFNESAKMVPDTERRMAASVATLKETVIAAQGVPELKEDEALLRAKEAQGIAEA